MTKILNKKSALIIYVIYALLLVLVISFGSDVAKALMANIKDVVLDYKITDVEIALDPEEALIVDQKYDMKPVAKGKFANDGDLVFASSNTSVLTVTTDGVISAKTINEQEASADIIITSKQDPEFKKTITFKVKHTYPVDFTPYYFAPGYGTNAANIMLGMPVYPSCSPSKEVPYTYTKFTVEYDEEYFYYNEEDGGYYAIKETDGSYTPTFTITYPDGKSKATKGVNIIPYTQADSFDNVKITNMDIADEYTIGCGCWFYYLLYKDDKTVQTLCDVTCSDPEALTFNTVGRYYFTKPGDFELTFTLPNGFSKTITVHSKNTLSLPTPTDEEIARTKHITLYEKERGIYYYTFDKSTTYNTVTFEYDESLMTVQSYWMHFSIIAKSTCVSTVKVIVDDGFERLEEVYTVEVVEDTRESAIINDLIDTFVSKLLGHMSMFVLLGMLAVNYLRFKDRSKKLVWWTLAVMLGLPWAIITEIIQLFMDGRFGSVDDAVLDMCGYLFGVAVALLIIKIIDNRRVRRLGIEAMARIKQEKMDGEKTTNCE